MTQLADSRIRTKILADNRKGHHPIETLFPGFRRQKTTALPLVPPATQARFSRFVCNKCYGNTIL